MSSKESVRHLQGEPPREATPAERARAVAAYNEYYAYEYEHALRNNSWGDFHKLEAGVKKATGLETIDPSHAIPDSYQGDGSFQTTYRIDGTDREVTQTEYLPWFFADGDRWKPFYHTLMQHSHPFKESHKEHYWDRVRLEAFFDAEKDPRASDPNHQKWIFQVAEWDLRVRREVILPTVRR